MSVEAKKINNDVELMNQAWKEALGRLHYPEDVDLTNLTASERSAEEIRQYLKEHESNLSPEGKFFLEATIQLREAYERLHSQ